jgi:hypothetical protein
VAGLAEMSEVTMRELADRWVLPIAGQTVTQCCVDDAFSLELSVAGRPEATIRISGPLELADESGALRLCPGSDGLELAPALTLLGLAIDHAAALKDGTLDVVFSGGTRLRVPPDPAYEAWEFIGSRGSRAIALPGGEVAIWRAAA